MCGITGLFDTREQRLPERERAVLVQPSVYGTDNTVMLQALTHGNEYCGALALQWLFGHLTAVQAQLHESGNVDVALLCNPAVGAALAANEL